VLLGKDLGKDPLLTAIWSALGVDLFFYRNGLCRERREQALGKECFLFFYHS
jgi:hypothetical protein